MIRSRFRRDSVPDRGRRMDSPEGRARLRVLRAASRLGHRARGSPQAQWHAVHGAQGSARGRGRRNGRGWAKRGYALGYGAGIAVGHATLGRIGFEGRYDYGAVGPVTSLAFRLQGEARPGQVLISQRALAMVEDLIEAESVGELTV